MELNEIDIHFARITWSVGRNYKQLDKTEKGFLQPLFNDYCKHTRGDQNASRRVVDGINTILGKYKERTTEINFSKELAVFGMMDDDDEPTTPRRENVRTTLFSRDVTVTGRPIAANIQGQAQNIRRYAQQQIAKNRVEEKLGKEQTKIALDETVKILLAQQQQTNEMIQASIEANKQLQESIDTNNQALSVEFVKMDKEQAALRKQVKELYEMQVGKQDFLELFSWEQVGVWLQRHYSMGLKHMAWKIATLPLTIAKTLTYRIWYRPLTRFVGWAHDYLELYWGAVMFVVTVGAVVKIYYSTDWAFVNQCIQDYGSQMGTTANLILYPTKITWGFAKNYIPGLEDYVFAFKILIMSIFEAIYFSIVFVITLLWDVMTVAGQTLVNSVISKIPGASYVIGTGTVEVPQTVKAVMAFFNTANSTMTTVAGNYSSTLETVKNLSENWLVNFKQNFTATRV